MKFSQVKRNALVALFSGTLLFGCQPPEQDPVSTLNGLAKDYGFIGYPNPMDEAKTGTLVSGRPTALSFVAHAQDCMPEEELERHYDHSHFNRNHSYTFQGNLGFLTSGNPVLSAGFGLKKEHFVNVELEGITIEYVSSVAMTDWYKEGMSETCKDYLDQVGFVIQALIVDKMVLSITRTSGNNIGLNTGNISQYFQFEAGVDWQIIDNYHVEITTPKYIGYQLGRVRKSDDGMTLYRAMVAEEDKFVFESLMLFEDDTQNQKSTDHVVSEIDDHAIFED